MVARVLLPTLRAPAVVTAGFAVDAVLASATERRGTTMSANLTSGVRAFLIADVRGYTRFTQEHGDEEAARLAQRFADTAELSVAEYDGTLIELRGDEALAVFSSARQALRAAVRMQHRCREPVKDGEPLPLEVGIGLDAGEAVPMEGGGYRGAALNTAARLCSQARGGQVLATEGIVHLAGRVQGLRFERGRPLRLKGVEQPVRPIKVVSEVPLPPAPTAAKPSARRRTPKLILGIGVFFLVGAGLAAFLATRSGGPSGLEAVAANVAGLVASPGGKILAEVPVGGRPAGLAVGGGSVWVTDSVNNTILRIDPSKRVVIDRIPVGSDPSGVAVGGGAVWAANSQAGTLSQVNPTTDAVVGTVRVGNGPTSLAFGAGSLWALNSVDGTVSRVAAGSGRIQATILLDQTPSRIAYGLGSLWVTSEESGLLLRVDPVRNQVVQAIPVGNGPIGVTVGGGAVWVANLPDRTVSKVDVGSGSVTKIAIPAAPQELAYGADGLWSGNTLSGTLTLIDTRTGSVKRTTRIESEPASLAPDGTRLWVGAVGSLASHRGGTLRVVSQGRDAFDSIDPGAAFRLESWQVLTMTNDGLLGFRRTGGPAGLTAVPDLATSLPIVSDDGRTYTFQLRKGIRYSTGQAVRAGDFRYALERELKAVPVWPTRTCISSVPAVARRRCATCRAGSSRTTPRDRSSSISRTLIRTFHSSSRSRKAMQSVLNPRRSTSVRTPFQRQVRMRSAGSFRTSNSCSSAIRTSTSGRPRRNRTDFRIGLSGASDSIRPPRRRPSRRGVRTSWSNRRPRSG
jgi:YVTN family beta-propeller protein